MSHPFLYKMFFNKFVYFLEVDPHGYSVEGASDDDHSSVQSAGSDGGVTVTTWKQLTIAHV